MGGLWLAITNPGTRPVKKDSDKTRTLENSVKDLTNKLDKLLSSTFKSSNSRVNPILIQGYETGISFMEPYSFIHF